MADHDEDPTRAESDGEREERERANRDRRELTGEAQEEQEEQARRAAASETPDSNPPRTTTGGWFTAPKFGSAGSGGAELEPGPERD